MVTAAVKPYSDATGLQTVRKDGKVSRPMNAFMLWSQAYRRELISKYGDGATVSKLLAEEWNKLGESEKKKWYNEAEELKRKHQIQHPDYKYSPKARKPRTSPRASRDDKQQMASGGRALSSVGTMGHLSGIINTANIQSMIMDQQVRAHYLHVNP